MTSRNHELRIKLTSEEQNIIRSKARALGMETSSFARAVLLKANIVIVPPRSL